LSGDSVAVVVVGDLARSPRMVNHARELARTGMPVSLVGYREREFAAPVGVAVLPLRPWRSLRALRLPGAAVRMTLTMGQLVAVLLRLKPGAILVQNPPAFPTLLAGWIAARLLEYLRIAAPKVAIVELDEGPKLTAQVVNCIAADRQVPKLVLQHDRDLVRVLGPEPGRHDHAGMAADIRRACESCWRASAHCGHAVVQLAHRHRGDVGQRRRVRAHVHLQLLLERQHRA